MPSPCLVWVKVLIPQPFTGLESLWCSLVLPAAPFSPLGAMGISRVGLVHMATLNVTGLTQVCVLCGSLHFTLGSRLGRRASDIPQLLSITVTVPWLHPSGRQLPVQCSPTASESGRAEPRA